MTLYLWHITVLVAVVGICFLFDGFGLQFTPASETWWATRPVWVLGLFLVLTPITLLLAAIEQWPRNPNKPMPAATRQVVGALIACTGVALMAMYGIGHPDALWTDIVSVGGILVGALIAGVGDLSRFLPQNASVQRS